MNTNSIMRSKYQIFKNMYTLVNTIFIIILLRQIEIIWLQQTIIQNENISTKKYEYFHLFFPRKWVQKEKKMFMKL